jgi:twitching motility protein PilJ
MEYKSFELVRQGRKDAALKLLLGKEYEAQKQIYAKGIDATLENVKKQTENQVEEYSNRLFSSLVFAAISLPVSAFTWIAILLIIRGYIRQQNQTQSQLLKTQSELLTLNQELEQRGAELVLREKQAEKATETLQTEISELLEVVSSIEQGDLTVQAEVGEGLTGIFADTLNRLLEELSSVMNAVLSTTIEVTYRASKLQDLAINTTERTQEQVNSLSEVEALTKYVTDLSQTNLEQAIAANEVVQQTRAAVLLGQQEMGEMTAGIVSLGEGSEQIVRRLTALQDFVELATQFSKEQKKVAALTRVLAFNASMTASRALEQQDPEQFATVAKEFETLASQINDLAAQTNDGLIVLQDRSDQIQTVVSGITENVKEINQLVRDFRGSVTQSNQVFDNIRLVTQQLTQIEQEINRSSKSIATAAQTTLKAISEIAATARETEGQAEVTRQQSEIMGQLADKLLQMVKFFRVSDNSGKIQQMPEEEVTSTVISDR